MEKHLDTPSQESSTTEMSVGDATQAFADLMDPPKEKPAKAAPVAEVEADPEPEAEEEAPEVEAQEVEPDANEVEEGADAPITLEVDGKQITLTKAELAEAYKNGLRQGDYTQKTMALAEQRKAAEAEVHKAQQERNAYAQNLQKMAAQLEGAIQQQQQIDWNALLDSDPVEFLKQKHLADQRQAALQQNQQQQQLVAQQIQADQAEQLKTHLSTQQQELLAKLPEWKDETKAKTERDAIKSYLATQGYEAKDIGAISDHRAVILARKAMRYDEMMAKAQAAAKKVSNLPTRVERPGVAVDRNPLDGRKSAMQRLSKTGSIDDATRLFESIL